ncbi:rhomboid family intramembrane serine protease [Jatrophihabitans fulvus]
MHPGGSGVAHCYRHPDRETGVRCVRCDRPICPECMRPASVGFHCPDDAREGARSIRAPRTSVGARITGGTPYVTFTLIALNVAAYLATGTGAGASLNDPTGSALFQSWQLQPYAIWNADAYYRLITSAFLHLSLIHIGANMLSLAFVGPALERLLGWWRFLALYLISALGGSAAVFAFGDQFTPTAGASGAIFGLLGACLVLVRRLGLDLQWLVAMLVLNFVITFRVDGISKEGHIGGFVTGLLCALAIGGIPRVSTRPSSTVQASGLGAVLVLVVLVVAVRSATFS